MNSTKDLHKPLSIELDDTAPIFVSEMPLEGNREGEPPTQERLQSYTALLKRSVSSDDVIDRTDLAGAPVCTMTRDQIDTETLHSRPVVVDLDENKPIISDSRQRLGCDAGKISHLKQKESKRSLFIVGLVCIFASVLVGNIASFLLDAFTKSSFLGWFLLTALALGIGLCVLSIINEISRYRKIAKIDTLTLQINDAVKQRNNKQLSKLLSQSCSGLRLNGSVDQNALSFQREVLNIKETDDILSLYANRVLIPRDNLAQSAVGKSCRQAAIYVAISPRALTDSLLFVTRAVSMLREVAEIYGHRPGFFGTVALARRLLAEAGVVGASSLAIEGAVQTISTGVLEWVSSAAAESALAAQRMARLGVTAMDICRPIEFAAGERPGIVGLLKAALKDIDGK